MTAFEQGGEVTTARIKAKREGVTLALSYWHEELRLRGVTTDLPVVYSKGENQ